jgi:ribosomal protein S18 acetylase RimI-like enzyme
VIIRSFEKSDYKQWLPLWTQNCQGKIDQAITNNTWQRICDPDDTALNGFGAFEGHKLVGIMHFIIHPITGSLKPACYMQDLYIAEDQRRKGYARALVNRLGLEKKEQGWERLYWLAEGNNEAAQSLYKSLGLKLDFTFHVLP